MRNEKGYDIRRGLVPGNGRGHRRLPQCRTRRRRPCARFRRAWRHRQRAWHDPVGERHGHRERWPLQGPLSDGQPFLQHRSEGREGTWLQTGCSPTRLGLVLVSAVYSACRESQHQEFGSRVRVTSASDGVRERRISFTCQMGFTSVSPIFASEERRLTEEPGWHSSDE